MAATTGPRSTDLRQGGFLTFPIAASTTINGGSMVATNSAGNAVPASADASLTVWGKASETKANTAAGNAAGDLSISIELSIGTKDFLYANDASSVGADDIGKTCYVKDDQTVTMVSTDTCEAGTVMGVTTAGVYVRFAF